MGLKDIRIEKCYETTDDVHHLLNNFYIPILKEAKVYSRIAGFFSSTSLYVASEGIEALVDNGGVMRLLISPEISESDLTILNSYKREESESKCIFTNDLSVSDFLSNDRLKLFAWLLSKEKLEIKIVVNNRSGNTLFHQKIGILEDGDGDLISFSGSINETAQAWLGNIEEFKTFKSWDDSQNEYLISDLKKFNDYWNDKKGDLASVFELPVALKNKIINCAPNDINDIASMKKYRKKILQDKTIFSLFPHQIDAVRAWKTNHKKILFEMATGTGKTRTAIGCYLELRKENDKLLTIISTPQNILSKQWKKDIEIELSIDVETSIIIDGSVKQWRNELEKILIDLQIGYCKQVIIYTNHATCSSNDFIHYVKKHKFDFPILFICDEVHAIGSDKQQNALLDLYDYRIGLSATPRRLYDELGTKVIREYFGNNTFEFTIFDALNSINPITKRPFLNNFNYYPIFIPLTKVEQEKYNHITRKIIGLRSIEEVDEEQIKTLLNNRARIIKNAELKIEEFEVLSKNLKNRGELHDVIAFLTENQITIGMQVLHKLGCHCSKITEQESTTKKLGANDLSEREEYIDQFRKGNTKVLLGLRCLDEGIDIKNARIAILIASSTNPREYIQRVGRVIRDVPGKKVSEIYDFIVTPNGKESLYLLEKEAKRADEISKNAVNYDDVIEIFKERGVDLNADKFKDN